MEVVGGIASATQLVAYTHVVARRLVQLYKAVQNGPQLYRIRRSHVLSLLDSVQRVCIGEAPDTDTILPLLISTTDLAHSLLYLLQPQSALCHLRLWSSKSDEIESTFQALNDKSRLLQLHITERTYNIVATVQKDIKTMNEDKRVKNANESPPVCPKLLLQSVSSLKSIEHPTYRLAQRDPHPKTIEQSTDAAQQTSGQGLGHLKLTVNGNKADGDGGMQRVGNGWGPAATSYDVEAKENVKSGAGSQIVAERGQVRKSGSGCSVC
ncbi:MAG: hypothetical protein LQ350_008366 [Teloschistes chrysophthalmus]|nr:MAG: hypothetical protein LQ350_008366 [Niorma chrysophthalma]